MKKGSKMAKKSIKKIKTWWTEENKKKHSELYTGEGNPQFGKKGKKHPAFGYNHPEKFKKLQSKRRLRVKRPAFTEEWKKNMSKSALDRWTNQKFQTRREPEFAKDFYECIKRKIKKVWKEPPLIE